MLFNYPRRRLLRRTRILPLNAKAFVVGGGGAAGGWGGGGGGGAVETDIIFQIGQLYAVTVAAAGGTSTIVWNGNTLLSRGPGSASTGNSAGGASGDGNGGGGWNGDNAGGGGGGDQAAGGATSGTNIAGNGGAGLKPSWDPSTGYAGGGGGFGSTNGAGVDGGGQPSGGAGRANSGGGGGGNGGAGAAGNVMIAYPGTFPRATGGTITILNGMVVHTFTANDNFSPFM